MTWAFQPSTGFTDTEVNGVSVGQGHFELVRLGRGRFVGHVERQVGVAACCRVVRINMDVGGRGGHAEGEQPGRHGGGRDGFEGTAKGGFHGRDAFHRKTVGNLGPEHVRGR